VPDNAEHDSGHTAAHNPDNYCYRHPDRESYIVCQRCGRTVCPECQTQAAVGVHCPECVKEARDSQPRTAPRTTSRIANAFRRPGNRPIVTYTLIGINVLFYVLEILPVVGNYVYAYLAYSPSNGYTTAMPWTMITSAFLHSPSSIFHILFNMYSLFIFGPMVEQLLGRIRFVVLYLIAAFAGSVGVLLLAPNSIVVGASGAIFGLLGAYFVIARRLGGNTMQLVIVIALNLGIGFFVPSVAWQAHLGGLIGGAAVALVFVMTRQRSQRKLQIALVAAIAAALIAITVFAVTA
jgi:membrane associated rhomboid family serine protease